MKSLIIHLAERYNRPAVTVDWIHQSNAQKKLLSWWKFACFAPFSTSLRNSAKDYENFVITKLETMNERLNPAVVSLHTGRLASRFNFTPLYWLIEILISLILLTSLLIIYPATNHFNTAPTPELKNASKYD
jgi:hypothetical protein